MIYIAVLCNSLITAEPLYNTPLFIGPYAAANNTALLAWRPSQGTKLYCLVNRGTLGVNNLPRVVARIMPRSESNPRPLDHESNALPLHHRVTSNCERKCSEDRFKYWRNEYCVQRCIQNEWCVATVWKSIAWNFDCNRQVATSGKTQKVNSWTSDICIINK